MASKVHRVRFYNPKPYPVNCVSFNSNKKILALGRSDASIELWDVNYAPLMIKFIPGVDNNSVEALGWINERLISTGLGGALIEWDLDSLCIKTTVLLTGYAAWCLDVNVRNTLVAVGTEQGYINLYSVEDNEIVYNKLFDKQEGRIICCKFDKADKILVTGSVDTIRVWDIKTGHAIHRLSVSRKGKETIVWCLAILSDNVIVSGDSSGRLTFWDGDLGEQLDSHATHRSDILSLVVSDDERSLYCSGLDPVIINFIKVNSSSEKEPNDKWVKNIQRHIHEHDVRALVLNGEQLISTGADGYLTCSSYPPKWVMRIPPMIPAPRSTVCSTKKLLLLRYKNHIEIWKMGSYAKNGSGNVFITSNPQHKTVKKENNHLEQDSTLEIINNAINEKDQVSLQLTDQPLKVASIQAKGKKQIQCCALSPSGEFIFYSTDSAIRMLKMDIEIDEEQTSASLSKLPLSGVPSACSRAAFTEDSRHLVVSSAGSLFHLLVDSAAGATVIHTVPAHKYLKTSSILHLIISEQCKSGATYLVVADTVGAVSVWTQKGNKFEHHVALPTYHCVPSAITVDSRQDKLIVVYVDQKILEYSLFSKQVCGGDGSGVVGECEAWTSRRSAALGVSAHPRKAALLAHDVTSLWILDNTTKDESPPSKNKSTKLQIQSVNTSDVKVIPIKYLADFHWLGEDEAVTIEILPEDIVSQLPPPFIHKKLYNS